MRKAYPSDLTDDQWALIEPHIPVFDLGRPREVDMREVLNAILYLNRSGCQWDMLPHDLPAKSTVYDYFARWRDDGTWQRLMDALRQEVRVAAGREPSPSAGEHRQPDGQGDRGRRRAGLRRGQEAHRGEAPHRRGHAGVAAGRGRLGGVGRRRDVRPGGAGAVDRRAPQPGWSWSGPTASTTTIAWTRWLAKSEVGYRIEVVGRPAGSKGFVKLPRRWVVERTFAWLGRYRRNSRDYEYFTSSSESMIRISSIHRMLKLLKPDLSKPAVPFKYRKSQGIITG